MTPPQGGHGDAARPPVRGRQRATALRAVAPRPLSAIANYTISDHVAFGVRAFDVVVEGCGCSRRIEPMGPPPEL